MTPLEVLIQFAAYFSVGTASLFVSQPQSILLPLNGTAGFNCTISNGTVQWTITLTGPVILLWPTHTQTLVQRGIWAVYPVTTQQSTLFVDATYQNNGTAVKCLSDRNPANQSPPAQLTAYDRPTAPPSKPSAALAGNLSVNISWVPPFSLPGVTTWYTVVVDGIAAERVVGRSYYIYRYTGNVPCQNHSIAVVAGNAAGDSGPSEPLLTDIPQVGQFVAAPNAKVAVRENLTTLILTSKVNTCRSFPLQSLYVRLTSATITNSSVAIGPYISDNNGSNMEIVVRTSDGLQPNMKYLYTITAVNMVGNSTTPPQIVYTTDVQSSTITGCDHQLNVTCFFAEGTQARGCVVRLERSGGVVYQMIPRVNETANGLVRTEFSVDCYNISVVDWEEDGSIGSLDIYFEMITSNNCFLAQDAFSGLLYIITGVTISVGVVVIAAVAIVVGMCCRRWSKMQEPARQDIQSSSAPQSRPHIGNKTFAPDPVYTSSILYVGEVGLVEPICLANGKLSAGNIHTQQWASHLAPPTPSHEGVPDVDYNRLHQQNTSGKRFSSSSFTYNPRPPCPAHNPSSPHLPPTHPSHIPTARGSPVAYALPQGRRPSDVNSRVNASITHEYETPFERSGMRQEGGAGLRHGGLKQEGHTAFTDV